eukprot:gene186-224_t
MNISEKYAGELLGNNYFRDTHVRIEGSAVSDLADAFYNAKRDKRSLFTAAIPPSPPPSPPMSPMLSGAEETPTTSSGEEATTTTEDTLVVTSAYERLSKVSDERKDQILYERYSEFYNEYHSDFNNAEDQWDDIDDDDDDDEIEDHHSGVDDEDMLPKIPVKRITPGECRVERVPVQVLESNLMRGKRNLQRGLSILLKTSKNTCYITTPYFLPPRLLRKAIIDTAKRGVNVKILTAGKSDTITIDGKYSTIGTYNFDHWSQRNLEVCVSFADETIANRIEHQFLEDLNQSEEITVDYLSNRSLFNKVYSFLAYQFGRIVRPTAIK